LVIHSHFVDYIFGAELHIVAAGLEHMPQNVPANARKSCGESLFTFQTLYVAAGNGEYFPGLQSSAGSRSADIEYAGAAIGL